MRSSFLLMLASVSGGVLNIDNRGGLVHHSPKHPFYPAYHTQLPGRGLRVFDVVSWGDLVRRCMPQHPLMCVSFSSRHTVHESVTYSHSNRRLSSSTSWTTMWRLCWSDSLTDDQSPCTGPAPSESSKTK
jgi:hypothetical protein